MNGITNAAIAAGRADEETLAKLDEIISALGNMNFSNSYKKIWCIDSSLTSDFFLKSPVTLEKNFKEIDLLVNDGTERFLVELFEEGVSTSKKIYLNPGESINDLHFSGVKIQISYENEIAFRMIVLGD